MNLENMLKDIIAKEPNWVFYYDDNISSWVARLNEVCVVEDTLTEVAIKLMLHYFGKQPIPAYRV
jgi:hypothetical protein